MNIDKVIEKLSDFCVNYAVAAFAVAAFQKNPGACLPGLAALVFAVIFAARTRN